MSGTLYIVGTPIGNLGDFSPRARQTLENADFIAAEDTRVTRKLLNHFDIHKETVSYFEHNQKARGEQIITRLLAGENCALVTDAGMPAISDPGQALVDQCIALGIRTEAVPGPVAFATALAVSGMENGRFTFEGFLSVNKKSRFAHLDELKDETRTMLFYEAPHKLLATLHDMAAAFGPDRKIALVRELGVLVGAILMAGRSGSAFAAELGAMKVNEEIDALETMGLRPVRFLVLPRVVAGTLALPLLSLFVAFAGLIGGGLVMGVLGFPESYYIRQLQTFVHLNDILGSFCKAFVFGFAVSAVGCWFGLKAGRDAGAVGTATTAAVVTGIVTIAVLEGIFSVVFYAMGW